jgi:hypothetical protein
LLKWSLWRPSWIQDGADGHNFERGPPKNHLSKVWLRFYELWTFTDFDRFCKLEKRGDGIKKILLLWNYWIIMLIQFKFGHFLD